jgi:hypothetical protein
LVAAESGRLSLSLGPGSVVEVNARDDAGRGAVVQLPFDKVRLSPAAGGDGLHVIARRFLGATVELHLAGERGTICAQMPLAEAAAYPVGSMARIGAAPEDCRLVPE